jgi:hypothetical protein
MKELDEIIKERPTPEGHLNASKYFDDMVTFIRKLQAHMNSTIKK